METIKDKIKMFIKKYYKIIIIFFSILIISEMIFSILTKEVMRRDIIGYELVSKYLISEKTLPIVKLITNFGGVAGIILIACISSFIMFVKKKKNIGILIWINLICSALLNHVLKRLIKRPRPTGYRLIEESGYSFPSGHSMISLAFYGFFIYLIFKNVKNKYIKYGSISLLCILILLIGISRVYLGVHYTSDVMAGFIISISYLIIFTNIAKEKLNNYKEDK